MTEEMLALLWSVTVSVFAVGGMIGGISGGAIADYCGRFRQKHHFLTIGSFNLIDFQ